MQLRVGCEFRYEAEYPVPTVLQVEPYDSATVLKGTWDATPMLDLREYRDLYGNRCRRVTMPAGEVRLQYDAVVEVPDEVDELDPAARQLPVENLPDDTLVYTLPSRYCLSDALSEKAWELFADVEPGWNRVQAICDWVHDHIRFQYGTSTPMTTSADVYAAGVGVCRDFAQLGVTFCRAMNIPARYVFGYLPDIGVPPPDDPMDFCAWFEAFLDGRWRTFDPRNNTPRVGRVVIGRGRDALDVAMVTTYGGPMLRNMVVWADEASQSVAAGARGEAAR